MLYSIVFLVGLCAGFLVAGFFFRRHYRNYQLQIEQRKEALRTIMYRTHHEGINPICKRIRGITNLGLIAVRSLPDCEYKEDVRLYFEVIESEARDLETGVLNKVTEFEHLQ